MSLPFTTSRAVFTGDGTCTRFPFTFKIWDASQLDVSLLSPDNITTPLHEWTVEINEAGGTLVCSPVPAGWRLAITRAMSFTQDVDLVSGTRFDPEVIETALDRACAERQQLREAVLRAVKLPAASAEAPEQLVQDIFSARNAAQAAAAETAVRQNTAADSATGAAASADTSQLWAERSASEATAAASAATLAQAWAESPASPDPDDATARSAKSWAEQAGADVSSTVARVTAEGDAQLARVTAEGNAQVSRVRSLASSTPAAGGIPVAGDDGRLAPEWLPSTFLAGGIVMFSGSFGGSDGKRPIPQGDSEADEGWALCDGTNGTPDLRGRFVMGAGGDHAQGDSGGAAAIDSVTGETTLTVAQMPSHTHTSGGPASKKVYHEAVSYSYACVNTSTSATGGSEAHSHSLSLDILPPYYALAYIMKLPA